MKDNNFEMQKLSMADSDDYDEYEEEVIDRDEEYDADDDEYDEEYDDEEYDDEEYDDEEYDDDYDDGYDDSYYDERLNKVLDELAELKRTVANPPAVQSNQPSYVQPSIPYVYAGNIPQGMNGQNGNSSNEVLMYNEISRLRDELSRTQSSQNLHVELNRLKDEMERDRKYNESQYLAEIRRLNEKIEALQKNALGPQSEDVGYLPESNASEGGNVSGSTFEKLISINELILQSVKSTDARLQTEITDIKKRLSALDTEELSRVVSSIKKLSKSGMNPEDAVALTKEIAVLKDALVSSGISDNTLSTGSRAKTDLSIAELKEIALDKHADAAAVIQKLFELGCAIGYEDESVAQSKQLALELTDDLVALRSVAASISFGDALAKLAEISKAMLSLQSVDAAIVADIWDDVASKVMCRVLDTKSADELLKFIDNTAMISISRDKRDSLDKFVTLSQRVLKSEPADVVDQLPQLLELKAKLQESIRQAADEATADEIYDLIGAAQDEANTAKLKELLATLCRLRACDVVKTPKAPVENKDANSAKVETMTAKLNKILELLSAGGSIASTSANAGTDATVAAIDQASLDAIKAEIVNLCNAKQLDDSVADLKAQYAQILNAISGIQSAPPRPVRAVSEQSPMGDDGSGEAQYSNNELSDQLYNVRDELTKAIHDESAITQGTMELKFTDVSEGQARLAADLEFIKNKLAETQNLIAEMSEARETVVDEANGEVGAVKINDDFVEQFDKLYEDISALLVTTENNIVDRINEAVGATMDNVNTIIDSINANIDSINALVAGVNTSLDGVNGNFEQTNSNISALSNALVDNFASVSVTLDDIKENIANLSATDMSALIADTVTELKIAVDDFISRANQSFDTASADRALLVEDVSFIRDAVGANSGDEYRALLDEIAQMSDNITRDLGVLTDTVSALNLDEMRESVATIKDTLDILASDTTLAAICEDIAEIKDTSNSLSEAIAHSGSAQEEFRALLSEDIAYIRSKLEEGSVGEGSVTIADLNDTLAAVNEKLDIISGDDRQDTETLIAYLEDIKEQLHLKELEPSIEGITGSEEEKQALLGEIAELRERLATLEESSKVQSDVALEQLNGIASELTAIKENLSVAPSSDVGNIDELISDLAARIDMLAQQDVIDVLQPLADDIAKIKEILSATDSESNDIADIMQTVNDMSDRVKDFSERMELASLEIESIPMVLTELSDVKNAIAELRDALAMHTESDSNEDGDDDIAHRLDVLSAKTNEIIERSGVSPDSIKEVSDEIADIRETLIADYERIKDDLSYIRSQIEMNVEEDANAEDVVVSATDMDLSTVLEELAEIKEKLSAIDEYDVMAEILSLREDLKTSRSPDDGESSEDKQVGSEIIERNELIIDEIRSLRNDLANLTGSVDSSETREVTDGELNLVLNEIVSLRDEIQSYKDEITASVGRTATVESDGTGEVVTVVDPTLQDNINVILDELTGIRSEIASYHEEPGEEQNANIEALRAGIDELHGEIDELKDMISRRTSVVSDSMVAEDGTVSASGLDVVLNELINLKNDIEQIRSQVSEDIKSVREGGIGEENLSEILQGLESGIADINARLDEGSVVTSDEESSDKYDQLLAAIEQLKGQEHGTDVSGVTLDIYSEILLLHNELGDIRSNLESRTDTSSEESDSVYERVLAELNDIKEQIAAISQQNVYDDYAEDGDVQTGSALHDELAEIKQLLLAGSTANQDSEISMLREEIAELKNQLAIGASDEVAALRAEIAQLREELASPNRAEEEYESSPDMGIMTELMSLHEELAILKNSLAAGEPVAAEPDMTVLTEVMALRDEMSALKAALGSGDSDMSETVAQIRDDVREIKDEPDLTALNEVLALRDEFQAMKEAMTKPKAVEETKSNDEILAEVQSLRDQLFAISMANVNDGTSSNVTYESYNNIILDEITALREEVNSLKSGESLKEIIDEISEIKRSVEAQTSDGSELMSQLAKLRHDIDAIKADGNEDVLKQVAALKEELVGKRDADAAMQNFMTELARLIERQNQYISENSSVGVADEIESLKAEIASASTGTADYSAVLREISKLKEELSKAPARQSDNRAVLNEISKLKAQMAELLAHSSEKPAVVETGEISRSIDELKTELAQIADLVGDDSTATGMGKAAQPKPQSKKGKSGKGGAKRGAKSSASTGMSSEELLSRIDDTTFEVPAGSEVLLDPNYVPSDDDDLDIASKLAKQVANKLIMEQLVEQLGDGGVPVSEVEEIVRDILPMEFNTVQIEEQSDQVKRLANSLVLDKLRARLTGKRNDDEE